MAPRYALALASVYVFVRSCTYTYLHVFTPRTELILHYRANLGETLSIEFVAAFQVKSCRNANQWPALAMMARNGTPGGAVGVFINCRPELS
jgi:hypothetical protein